MAQGKQALKTRIRSIQATCKITGAMEMIATGKLQKQKALMQQNREYASYLKDMVQQILADNTNLENEYLKQIEDTRPLTILFTSDLGLCGGYNTNMLRFLSEEVDPKDPMMLVGMKGSPWLRKNKYKVINSVMGSDGVSFIDLANVANQALELFRNKEITSIRVLYTKFVNSIHFAPAVVTLLPVKKEEREKSKAMIETIFEPNPNAILDDLIPMYVRSMTYSYWLETKTSEQASRRMAMENATDNAEELIDALVLQFNQARQAAITQEITEIVAGSDAL